MPDLTLLVVIAGCGLVQSLFGTGLLLFGTPALLMLDYSFPLALKILLPCSMAVNACQVWEDRRRLTRLAADIIRFSVPAILLGLAWVLNEGSSFPLRPIVAAMLFLTALTRLRAAWVDVLRKLLLRRRQLWLVLTGLVHGLSNLGGGLLMLFTSTVFPEKQTMRVHTAWGYLLMACAQLILLEWMNDTPRPVGYAACVGTALGSYFALGRLTFRQAGSVLFRHLLTGLMLCFAMLLIVF